METHRDQAREGFAQAVRGPDAEIDLFAACLHVAAEEYPGLEFEPYTTKVAQLAEMVRDQVPASPSMYDILHATNEVLFEVAGLRGNSSDYYDPRNSFLNQVIDRGLGIPITLSVIYMEVASRAGLRMSGIGMPGHFLLVAGESPDEI